MELLIFSILSNLEISTPFPLENWNSTNAPLNGEVLELNSKIECIWVQMCGIEPVVEIEITSQ